MNNTRDHGVFRRRNRRRRQNRQNRRPKLAIKQSLPNQETTDVSFIDVYNVQPLGLVQGDRRQWASIGTNGWSFDATGSTAPPQLPLWNTYARMYEKYTVMSIRTKFVPFTFRYQAGTVAGGLQVKEMPNFSIIDCNLSAPVDSGQFASHGPKNFKISAPGAIHTRDYLDLQSVLIKNQPKVILNTNGGWTNREQYSNNSNVRYLMTSPIDGNEVFGILVIQYTYRFLGKTRGDEGFVRYDMTDLESVKQAHLASHSTLDDSSLGIAAPSKIEFVR